MAIPTEVAPNRNPQPFFLALKKDMSGACTLSQRMKRAAAVDEELDVFAAEQYFSGAIDMLNQWKISPEKKFSLPSPPHPTSTTAPSMDWKHPILSLFSFLRKSPSPKSMENDNSSPQTWNKSIRSTSRNTKRSFWGVMADPDVDMFSESSSDLFELDTLSIRTSAFGAEKSAKCSPPGDPFGEETAAPAEWGYLQVGCWGRKALNVAVGVHRASVKQRPEKWDSMCRPASKLSSTPRISAPISALSLR